MRMTGAIKPRRGSLNCTPPRESLKIANPAVTHPIPTQISTKTVIGSNSHDAAETAGYGKIPFNPMALEPGHIFWALLEGPTRRPVIIVSREEFNRGSYVLVVPVTSRRVQERKELPGSVYFKPGDFGFTKECVAQAEALAQIHLDELDIESGPMGRLDVVSHRNLLKAIGYVLGAEYEPT